jgi:acetolactate synthase-1/2/3 large subunit
VFDYLASLGAQHIFLVTGRGALFLSDAVEKNETLRSVCTHHEQAAAFAAVAYAEASDLPGVCLTSTGCSSTNTITGVLTAWQDGVPCYFISGQNSLAETTRHTGEPIRTYGQQEADIVEMVSSITKHAVFVSDPAQIRFELEKATFLAHQGRPGPVWIDIPLDVQNMRVDPDLLRPYEPENGDDNGTGRDDDVSFLKQKLEDASRPVILIGAGVKLDGAAEKLKSFAEKNNLPVTYTSAAADVYGSTNSNSIGSVGVMGCSRAGAFSVQNSDLLIVLGSRLPSSVVGVDVHKFARDADIIVVDENRSEFERHKEYLQNIIPRRPGNILDALLSVDLEIGEDWLRQCQHWKQVFANLDHWENEGSAIDLHNFASVLSDALPEEANFICDSGFIDVILPTNMSFSEKQKCIHPVYQGAMGFALPAAMGAYLATKKTTVAVIGDGSVMMNLQELQTIAHNDLPIKIIVINNGGYAIIKRRQKELFRKRTIGTDSSNGLSVPEFSAVSACFGIRYEKLDRLETIEEDLSALLATPEAMLIEVNGLPDQIYVEVAFAKTQERKFSRRPLEDQYPFMDRNVFSREMIIPAIDQ